LTKRTAHSLLTPAAGLELVDALTSEPSLKNYYLLPSVRGDLLAKLGRFDEARMEFERAVSLTRNVRERELLLSVFEKRSAFEKLVPRKLKALAVSSFH
jgi:predicted RNA polymerase sigma factor